MQWHRPTLSLPSKWKKSKKKERVKPFTPKRVKTTLKTMKTTPKGFTTTPKRAKISPARICRRVNFTLSSSSDLWQIQIFWFFFQSDKITNIKLASMSPMHIDSLKARIKWTKHCWDCYDVFRRLLVIFVFHESTIA